MLSLSLSLSLSLILSQRHPPRRYLAIATVVLAEGATAISYEVLLVVQPVDVGKGEGQRLLLGKGPQHESVIAIATGRERGILYRPRCPFLTQLNYITAHPLTSVTHYCDVTIEIDIVSPCQSLLQLHSCRHTACEIFRELKMVFRFLEEVYKK